MYNSTGQSASILAPTTSYPSSPMNPTQAPEYGVQSALKELEGQIAEALNLAGNLRSSVGISNPEAAAQTQGEGTLASLISSFANRVRVANDRLSDVLRHLNC